MALDRSSFYRGAAISLRLLVVIALCFELSFLLSSILSLSSPKDVLSARDDDAAVFLGVTMRTTWLNDVEAPYGPLYYRLSATVEKLVPDLLLAESGYRAERRIQTVHHFAMMLVSILSFISLAVVVSLGIRAGWRERFAVVLLLIPALLHYRVWSAHVFRAHPELLLTALLSIATWFALKVERGDGRLGQPSFYLAAMFFGMAAAVKHSAGGFAAGYVILLIVSLAPRDRRALLGRLFEAVTAVGTMLLTYFAVGFPTTLYLGYNAARTADFMSRKSMGFSLQWSFEWLVDFGLGLLLPGMVVFLSVLLIEAVSRRDGALAPDTSSPPRVLGDTWASWLIVLAPLALVLKTRMIIPTEHYMLSMIGSFLVIEVVSLRRFAPGISRRLAVAFEGVRLSSWAARGVRARGVRAAFVASAAILTIASGGALDTSSALIREQLACIPTAKKAIDSVLKERNQNIGRMIITPYFPCPIEQPCRQVWRMTDERVRLLEPAYIGISDSYADRFVGEVSEYDRHNCPDWKEVQAFHRTFYDKTGQVSISGRTWELVFRTGACGLALWKRLPDKDERDRK